MTKLEALKKAFEQINIEKGKTTKDEIDKKEEDEMIDLERRKKKRVKQRKRIKQKLKKRKLI